MTMASISAIAPNAPMRESFMISSRRSLFKAAEEPVSRIGQSVLMQGAANANRHGNSDGCR